MSNNNQTDLNTAKFLTIDLNTLNEAKAIDGINKSIQVSGLTRLCECVASVLRHIDDFKKDLDSPLKNGYSYSHIYRKMHETITVHGRRGAGKTSFLLSSLQVLIDLKNNEAVKNELNLSQETKKFFENKKLHSLGVLDPTLMATSENLLNIVLQRIEDSVEMQGKYRATQRYFDEQYEIWRKKFVTLSHYLKGAEAEPIKPSMTDDAIWNYERRRGLIRTNTYLEFEFHCFIAKSLDVLEADAFILGLDDIDTMPEAGWEVLETLRRYFTTPQLITILCGDMNLYSALIRSHQANAFEMSLNDFQQEKIRKASSISSLMDDIVEQYILKMLSTDKRINLGHFKKYYDYYSSKGVCLKILKDEKYFNIDILLDIFYENIIYCQQYTERGNITAVLLNNPMRKVLQLLSSLHALGRLKENESSDEMDIAQKKEKIRSRLADVFLLQLNKLGYQSPTEDLEGLKDENGLIALAIHLWNKDILEYGVQLKPYLTDDDLNLALITVEAFLTDAMHTKPSLLISYFLRLAALCDPGLDTENKSLPLYVKEHGLLNVADWFLHYFLVSLRQKQRPPSRYGAIETVDQLHMNTKMRDIIKNRYRLHSKLREKDKEKDLDLLDKADFSLAANEAMAGTKSPWEKQNIISLEKSSQALEAAFHLLPSFRHSANYLSKALKVTGSVNKAQQYLNSLLTLTKGIRSWHNGFAAFPFVVFEEDDGSSSAYASFFSIIALLGELLECEPDSREISQLLFAVGQLRRHSKTVVISQSDYLQEQLDANGDSTDAKKSASEQNKTDSEKTSPVTEIIHDKIEASKLQMAQTNVKNRDFFVKALMNWKRKWNQCLCLSPATLMAKLMKRFQSNITGLEKNLISKTNPYQELAVGHYVHLAMVTFLNAALVEEFLLRSDQSKRIDLSFSNDPEKLLLMNMGTLGLLANIPKESSVDYQLFKELLRKELWPPDANIDKIWDSVIRDGANQNDSEWAKYPFFSMLFECPLSGLYFEPTYGTEQAAMSVFIQHLLRVGKCNESDERGCLAIINEDYLPSLEVLFCIGEGYVVEAFLKFLNLSPLLNSLHVPPREFQNGNN